MFCSFIPGTLNLEFETKFQSERGILDPEDKLLIYLNREVWIKEKRKLESEFSFTSNTQKSPTADPSKLANSLLSKYGRNLPKRMFVG